MADYTHTHIHTYILASIRRDPPVADYRAQHTTLESSTTSNISYYSMHSMHSLVVVVRYEPLDNPGGLFLYERLNYIRVSTMYSTNS